MSSKQHRPSIESWSGNSKSTLAHELAFYIEVVGGEKKRRVYGLGSHVSSYYGCSNSNANIQL